MRPNPTTGLSVWVSNCRNGVTSPQASVLRGMGEAQATMSTLESLATRTRRVDKAADDARAKMAQASTVVRRVDQIDDLLARVIRQLKPLAKLPATRSLGPVVGFAFKF